MMRKIVCTILLAMICCPFAATAYSKKGMFLHEYTYTLADVLDADRFVEKKGYREGYKNNQLVGYVFSSIDWAKKILGYSGQHIETLIGLDTRGVITDVKIISHAEPIVLIGLKEANYHAFMQQYRGKDLSRGLTIGGNITIDAISGATVTAVVQNAIILRSARRVAMEIGLLKRVKTAKHTISTKYVSHTWKELSDLEAIKRLKITSTDLGIDDQEVFLDLYMGIATPPSIGKNILGDLRYKEMVSHLEEGESAIVVFSKGKGSFKGSGFARGGLFDRFNLTQQEQVYFFREADYKILTDIKAEGAPSVKEGGIFIVRDKGFDPAGPFEFHLVLPYRIGGKKEFRSFKIDYTIPDAFLEQ